MLERRLANQKTPNRLVRRSLVELGVSLIVISIGTLKSHCNGLPPGRARERAYYVRMPCSSTWPTPRRHSSEGLSLSNYKYWASALEVCRLVPSRWSSPRKSDKKSTDDATANTACERCDEIADGFIAGRWSCPRVAWIAAFSCTQNTAACCGGARYNPILLAALDSKSGSSLAM